MDYPLPDGTVLTEGDYYGLKLPEFQGDPVVIQPYALVQHDKPEGYVYIKALSKTEYEVVNHRPETSDDLNGINGLLPMAVARDTDVNDRPRRSRMLQSSATRPTAVNVVSDGNVVAPALAAPAPQAPAAKGKGKQADPLASLASA